MKTKLLALSLVPAVQELAQAADGPVSRGPRFGGNSSPPDEKKSAFQMNTQSNAKTVTRLLHFFTSVRLRG